MTMPDFSLEDRRAIRWVLGLVIAILLGGNMILLTRVQTSFDNMASKIEQLIVDQTKQTEKQVSTERRMERFEYKVDKINDKLIQIIEESR